MEKFINKENFSEIDTSFVMHALISVYGMLENDEMDIAMRYLMQAS
jgi:hypothetical protein